MHYLSIILLIFYSISLGSTITFSIDMSNSDYPNQDYDNVVINGSWNSWSGWGVTLNDEDGDEIYEGSLEVDNGTYEYVIAMLKQIFGHPLELGLQLAEEVDLQGRAIILTTTMEHAELKRDQIHAFGKDPYIKDCRGSMSASIEPES